MPKLLMPTLRMADRIGRRVLPAPIFAKMRAAVIAALKAYERGTTEGETGGKAEAAPVGRVSEPAEIDRDALAWPIAPVIGVHRGSSSEPLKPAPALGTSDRERCKLVICCAFRGRHRILEKIIRESFAANNGQFIRWMLVGSTAEDYAFIRAISARTGRVAGTIVENNPLGRKWQTCVFLATVHYKADLYGITGSDDMVSPRLIDHIVERHTHNLNVATNPLFVPAMYGTLEWLVLNTSDSLSPQVFRCNYDLASAFEPLGAGRFYSRSFLESCRGLIFESNKDVLLDDRGYFEVHDSGRPLEYYTMEDGPLISIKGDWQQLNSLEKMLIAPTLKVEEYSFRGRALLEGSLTSATMRFMFRSSQAAPQLNFSDVPLGIDTTSSADAQPEVSNVA